MSVDHIDADYTDTPSTALAVRDEQQKMQPLAKRTTAAPARYHSFDELGRIAQAFAASGMFKDANDQARAMTKILAGQELGIPPLQAMTQIYIVDGKPTLAAPNVGALVKRSGRYDYRVRELTNKVCELEFFDRGVSAGASRFTIEDAQTAGLASKDVWKKYPRNMLFSRAMTNGARWFAAEAFNGAIYSPDEVGEVEIGDDGQMRVVELPAAQEWPAETPAAPAVPPLDADKAGEYAAQIKALSGELGWANSTLCDFIAHTLGDDRRSLKGATEAEWMAVRDGLAQRAEAEDVRVPPSQGVHSPPAESVLTSRPAEEPHKPGTDLDRVTRRLFVMLKERGMDDRPIRLEFAAENGFNVESFSDLTPEAKSTLIRKLEMIQPKVQA